MHYHAKEGHLAPTQHLKAARSGTLADDESIADVDAWIRAVFGNPFPFGLQRDSVGSVWVADKLGYECDAFDHTALRSCGDRVDHLSTVSCGNVEDLGWWVARHDGAAKGSVVRGDRIDPERRVWERLQVHRQVADAHTLAVVQVEEANKLCER